MTLQPTARLEEIFEDSEEGFYSPQQAMDAPPSEPPACAAAKWAAIEADPRWPPVLAMLHARGFRLTPGPAGTRLAATMLRIYTGAGASEATGRWPAPSSAVFRNATVGLPSGVGAPGTNYVVWNGLMAERMSTYKVRAFAAAALPHFPALRYSDFGCPGWNASFCTVPANDGSLSRGRQRYSHTPWSFSWMITNEIYRGSEHDFNAHG